jgi:hypothetical protein
VFWEVIRCSEWVSRRRSVVSEVMVLLVCVCVCECVEFLVAQ